MNAACRMAFDESRRWTREVAAHWNKFWFAPTDPATLCLIRLLGGAMLFYTHLVWSRGLQAFLGPQAWISRGLLDERQQGTMLWTLFRHIDSPVALWGVHLAALVVFFCLMVGFCSRAAAVLSYLLLIAYLHRVTPAAQFGLDQINTIIAMYLMLGPCGARYSVDAWLRRRRSRKADDDMQPAPSVTANVALRLMQLHMCVMYFFAAARKLSGETWWDGSAMWYAFANLEYQSIPMQWLADWPLLIVLFSHVTIFWELSYAALIWPRLSRPMMLVGAVVLHLGIALFLGMATFGLAMIIGNLAFLPAGFTRRLIERKPQCVP